MAAPNLGPWEPLAVDAVQQLFASCGVRWWVSGGRALELHVGRSWRDHEDTDVGMLRNDVSALPDVLVGWEIWVAAGGRLRPWYQEALAKEENNLWCRPQPEQPWALDLSINEGDTDGWVFRRDPGLRVPWLRAVLCTHGGLPYLAPEIQLLFKSREPRDKDDDDARQVIPVLDPARRQWLARRLDPEHAWQPMLAAVSSGSESR
jgi:hypothetical protein